MKKQICFLLLIGLILSLAACSPKKNVSPVPSETASTSPSVPDPTGTTTQPTNGNIDPVMMIAVSVPTVTEQTAAADGTVLFKYTYQNPSLVLHKPEVADKIILDLINRIDSTRADANSVANSAKSAYSDSANWAPYLYHLAYSPARIDQQVLSFFGTNETYTGGPHPSRTCISASYDLSTGDVLTLASIMTKDASADDFCQLVLDGLSGRAEGDYLYENYSQTVKQRFTTDTSLDENWYFSTTGLCFFFAPYEIAPYTSGIITVEIPYEKLQALVHPDYLPTALGAATGSIAVSPFADVELGKFSHIAELVADKGGEMYMVYADAQVQDVKIKLTENANSYTVFAANILSAGDAVMIQANNNQLKNMELSYSSGGETVKMSLIK